MKTIRRWHDTLNTGNLFGRLSVSGQPFSRLVGTKQRKQWFVPCVCDCGKEIVVSSSNLKYNNQKSCGCKKSEETSARKTKHGDGKAGGQHPLYISYHHMRSRCCNPNNKDYHHYGGRGIEICDDWAEYPAFKKWAVSHGYAEGLSIDRIDNDLPYHPENCRWVTQQDQVNNQRSNIIIDAFGEERTIGQWAKDPRCRVCYSTLYSRLTIRFWEPERAITMPPTQPAAAR